MASADEVLAAAMKLSVQARAHLVYKLLESLEAETDARATREMTDELARRLRDVRDDAVELVPLAEVKQRMAERRAARTSE